jgi:protoporphyrin/coproporphyrin ferrochelatase
VPPSQPWLVPDVNDLLADLAAAGSRAVAVVPVGFVSDHMEVRFDLDVEAAQTAERLGLAFARARTPGISPPFVAMVTDLVRQWQAAPPAAPPGRPSPRPPGGVTAGFCAGAACCAPAPAAQAAR